MKEKTQQPIEETPSKTNEPRKPDYVSNGVAVWKNTDKNNKEYLTIKIVGHDTIYANQNG